MVSQAYIFTEVM